MGKIGTRRRFLKTTALAGMAGMAGCGANQKDSESTPTATEVPSTPTPAQQVSSWDRVTDVLIIGFGGAGSAASIEAAQEGSDVLVLEKTENGGGTTGHAGGIVYLGGGTPLQEEFDVEDSAENMAKYLIARNPNADEGRIREYAENSVDFYNWLVDLGVPFPKNFTTNKVIQINDGGLQYSGSEPAYPYSEVATPAPRGHRIETDGQAGSGHKLFSALETTAKDSGVEVLYNTEVRRLVTDSDGRVIGVKAQGEDGEKFFKGTQGIIIATGGFGYNKAMVREHNPDWLDAVAPLGVVPVHDGVGIKLAQSVGAQTYHMDEMYGWSFVYPFATVQGGTGNAAMVKGIAVDMRGRRFINEDRYGGDIGHYVMEQSEGVGYHILDDKLVDEYGGMPEQQLTHVATEDSVSKLAESAGLPPAPLSNSIEFYNSQAEQGNDPVFHKKEKYLQPLVNGPYHIFNIGAEANSIVFMTLGGIGADVNGEAFNQFGERIEGLYACSRAVSGIPTDTYDSGLGLGASTYFGRLAGRNAAQ